MNKSVYSMADAAKALGRSPMVIYAWANQHPEYFTFQPAGKVRRITITPANLEALRILKRGADYEPPAILPHPTLKPTAGFSTVPASRPPLNVRVQNVGWWCRRCGDLMPSFRLVCRCLWAEPTEAAMERHRKEFWKAAYVDITVSAPGRAG